MAALGARPRVAKSGYGTESQLYKSIGFLKRLPSMTHEEFVRHWQDIHAPLFKPAPGLVKYVLNVIDPRRFPNVPYDGAAEIWFESERAFIDTWGSEIGRKNAADAKTFIAPDGLVLNTQEIVIIEPPRGPKRPAVKRIGLVQKKPGLSGEEFIRRWRDVHAPEYLESTPGIRGYTINAVHPSASSPWAGYASLWWEDQASYDKAARVNQASLAKLPQGDENIFGGQFMSMLMDEHVIV